MIELVEACVDSLASARAAQEAGAGRLELCGPGEGGLTPSRELLESVMQVATVPVHVMIRPREGGFSYSTTELGEMLGAVRAARDVGAQGVVYGVLREDSTVDLARMAELIVASYPMRTCFHRAFDHTPDADAALDDLLALGMNVVLTSGHARTALEGAPLLARHVQRAAGRIRILAGGNVRAENVGEITRLSRVRQVHARATDRPTFSALMAAIRALKEKRVAGSK